MPRKQISENFVGYVHTIYGIEKFYFTANLNSRTPTTCYNKLKRMFIDKFGLGEWNYSVYDISWEVSVDK